MTMTTTTTTSRRSSLINVAHEEAATLPVYRGLGLAASYIRFSEPHGRFIARLRRPECLHLMLPFSWLCSLLSLSCALCARELAGWGHELWVERARAARCRLFELCNLIQASSCSPVRLFRFGCS